MTANRDRPAALAHRCPPNKRNIELQLWLRLLACSNLITAHLRGMLRREFGLSLPSFDVLAQIARPPIGPTMGELSKRLMVSKGSVTELIERLTGQGLVTRSGDINDARVQRVYLTAKGRRLLDRVLPVHNNQTRKLMAALRPAAISELSTRLGELRSALRNVDSSRGPARSAPRGQVVRPYALEVSSRRIAP